MAGLCKFLEHHRIGARSGRLARSFRLAVVCRRCRVILRPQMRTTAREIPPASKSALAHGCTSAGIAAAAFAFDHSPIAMIYAEHRVIRRANAAFAQMFEMAPEYIEGQILQVFYPSAADSERIAQHAQEPLRSTGYYSDERTMQRISGELFWCAVVGHSLTPDDPYAQSVWCFQDLSRQWDISSFSPRDREIAILTCEGRTAKEVARLLRLSPRTVENYLARLKHKLEVRNVAELVSRMRPVVDHH